MKQSAHRLIVGLFLLGVCSSHAQTTITLPGRSVVKLLSDDNVPRVYALNQAALTNGGTLLALNATNGTILAEIAMGINPTDMTLTLAGDALYVINTGSRTIAKVDLASFRVISEKPIPAPVVHDPTQLHIAAGRSNLVYYTDGVWLPGIRTGINTLDYESGTNIAAYNNGYGTAGMVVSQDGNTLFECLGHSSYLYSWVRRLDTRDNNGLVQYNTNEQGPGQSRDPGDAPTLLNGPGTRVFSKLQMLAATNVSMQLASFSENIYAIILDGTIAFGPSAVFNATTAAVLTNLPLSSTVQIVSGDGKQLFRYRSPTSELDIYPLANLLGSNWETNQPPTANFSRTPTNATTTNTITFSAADSTDDQGGGSALKYRWDWESDGFFDTPFTNLSFASHHFNIAGTKTVTLQVADRFGQASTMTQTFVVAQGTDTGVPGGGNTPFVVPFPAADVAFDPIRPYAYVSGYSNRVLAVLNLTNGLIERQFNFDWMAESITISPNGQRMYVALLTRPHDSMWWDELGHIGYIAEFDLEQQVKSKEFQINEDPYDLAVTDSGILVVPGGSAQFTYIRSYRTLTGELLGTTDIRQKSRIALHPSQQAVYTANTDILPSEIYRYNFDPTTGAFSNMWDSPYSGEYPMGGTVWCHPNGTNVIVRGGGVFTSSAVLAQDMRYLSSLPGATNEAVSFDPMRRAIHAVSGNELRYYNDTSYQLASKQTLTLAPGYVHAAGTNIYVAGVTNNRTYFQRLANPALGAETNQNPVASFVRIPAHATTLITITFDANGSTDDQGGGPALQYRWDWEGDGSFDTTFTNQSLATHRFLQPGNQTVTLQLKDRYGAVHSSTQTFNVPQEDDPGIPWGTNAAFEVPFAAADIVFDPVRPYAYVCGTTNRTLVFLNLTNGLIERQFTFAWDPRTIAVSPNGQSMCVGLVGTGTNSFAAFDLVTQVQTGIFGVLAAPFDLALTDAGILAMATGYGFSGSAGDIRTFRASTGQPLSTYSGLVYQRSRIGLHSSQQAIYTVRSDDAAKTYIYRHGFDPVTGVVTNVAGVVFQSSFLVSANVWCHPNGTNLLLRSGDVATSLEAPEGNMHLQRRLEGGIMDAVAFDLPHLAFFSVGNSQLRYYNQNTLELAASRGVSNWVGYVHAAATNVYVAGTVSNRTYFQRLSNPAGGAETNTPPVPVFARTPASATTLTPISFDATGTTDDQGGGTALQYRWDWDGDGIYDTAFTNQPVATFQYNIAGTKTVTLQVKDRYGAVSAMTEVFNVQEGSPGNGSPWFEVQFAAADVAFDPLRPFAYVSSSTNKLVIVNLTNGFMEQEFKFDLAVGTIVISPNGQRMYAALIGTATNRVAEFDLATQTKTKEFGLIESPYDMEVTDAGILIVSGPSLHTYRTGTGQRVGSVGISESSRIGLHPGQRAVYVADNKYWSYSEDLWRCDFDPVTGTITNTWDSPYSGQHLIRGDVWCPPNGTNLITRGGSVFSSSSTQAEDMNFWKSLAGGAFDDASFDPQHRAFFTVGGGQLYYYNQDSFEPPGNQTVSNWAMYVHASPNFVFLAGVTNNRTYFQRIVNPAMGAETNQVPVAAFTRTPTNGTMTDMIAFNAGNSTDDQGGGSVLRYRWDWNGDGSFDTAFTNSPVALHRFYNSPGTKTVTLEVMDRYGSTHTATQSFIVELGSDPGTLDGTNRPFEVPFAAVRVAFDPVRPYAYVSGYAERMLAVMNLTNGLIERQFNFDWPAESIAVSPNGTKMYVALLHRDHGSEAFSGHTNNLAEFDLGRQVKTRELQIFADPYDLAVTDGGILLMSGGSGQLTDVRSYRTSTGELAWQSGNNYQERRRITLHAFQNSFYCQGGGFDRISFDFLTGDFVSMRSRPFVDSGGAAWGSPHGANLVTSLGEMVTSSPVDSEDMVSVQYLTGGPVEDASFDLAHHAFFTIGSGQLQFYNADTFQLISSQPVSNGVHYVKASGSRVYLGQVENGLTRFSWVENQALADLVILTQPLDQPASYGTNISFTVGAFGSSPLGYQWFKDGVTLSDGAQFAGATNYTLTVANITGADSGDYYVMVSNSFGSITSRVASLVVADPIITVQPAGRNLSPGQGTNFSVVAFGTAPLRYQWLKDGFPLQNGAKISGATNPTLSVSSVLGEDAGNYSATVSSPYGSITSTPAMLTVNLVTLDTAFNPSANGAVNALAIQPDGKILVGGNFTALGGQVRNRMGRLNTNGTLDTSFNPNVSGTVSSVLVQGDGKIVVGGTFTTVGGLARTNLARLNTNGTVDTSFTPFVNGRVASLAQQVDGKLLLGGSFSAVQGQARYNIARINSNGTLDVAFNPGINTFSVTTLALQGDGRILVCGTPSGLQTQELVRLVRFNADGSPDATFIPVTGGVLQTLALQADSQILVGGGFMLLAGETRNRIARLNPDGTVEGSFIANDGDGQIISMVVQADGKILLAGQFSLVGGQIRNRIARLNPGGSVDNIYNPSGTGSALALAIQADGKVLVGGQFTSAGGQTRSNIVRFNATGPATQYLSCSGNKITWLRSGTAPEDSRVSFDHSFNGTVWTNLGMATHMAGGWQLTNVTLPPSGQLRARAFVSSGQNNGSGGIIETIITAPLITVQPTPQVVIPEGTATFSVSVSGTAPFTCQWLFDDSPITGATNTILTVNNITPGVEGDYSVIVGNAYGAVTSNIAPLRITPRAVVLLGTNATPGSTITLPVLLISDDDENALAFSVAYNTNLLSFVSATNGADALDALFTVDATQLTSGRMGLSLAKPAGTTFASGTYELALLTFNVAALSNAVASPLTFGDAPVARGTLTTNTVSLPTLYLVGGVSVLPSGTIAQSTGSSLFQQIIRVTNPPNAGGSVRGIRVWFHDLGVDSKGYPIRVYNATGTSNGVPFLDYNAPLAPGQSVNLTVEYYIADRKTMPRPRLVVEFLGLQTFEVPEGTTLSVMFQLLSGAGVVEFNTLAGQTYYVQYAEDANGTGGWKTAQPAIIGTGGVVQWIDNGPPKTESAPSETPSRFYRVLLVTP